MLNNMEQYGNQKITVFNAMRTIKELAEGQEALMQAVEELAESVEEIATETAVNNCKSRLEELRKRDKMREEVIDYLFEIGADNNFVNIPVEILREWKNFLPGSYKGKLCEISGSVRYGRVKIYSYSNTYSISIM